MAIPGYAMTTAARFVGQELGASDWTTVDQDRINQFAACTGDHQWIHVDAERARREGPFGGTIAHGYLTLSMVAPLAMELGVIPPDAAAGLNYGLDKVRFIAPVKAGARVRARVSLLATEPQSGNRLLLKLHCTLEIEAEPKPGLVAEMLCMLIGRGHRRASGTPMAAESMHGTTFDLRTAAFTNRQRSIRSQRTRADAAGADVAPPGCRGGAISRLHRRA
jgi:acyl dehydratase